MSLSFIVNLFKLRNLHWFNWFTSCSEMVTVVEPDAVSVGGSFSRILTARTAVSVPHVLASCRVIRYSGVVSWLKVGLLYCIVPAETSNYLWIHFYYYNIIIYLIITKQLLKEVVSASQQHTIKGTHFRFAVPQADHCFQTNNSNILFVTD